MKKELGSIDQVELRDVWPTEPEFTRWISEKENLAALGDELDIDLVWIETESEVGDFSADILAIDAASNDKVIIENQFGTTNHDHLGKILTYASGHEARYVIWIFEEIREEHRQALDWLNNHTTEDIAFFGVKIELWQIEGSKPAPRFDVVCRPNEWAKTVKRHGDEEEWTETKLRQFEFWTQLKAYVDEKKSGIKLQSPHAQHWTNISIGTSGVHIALTVNTVEDSYGCVLYINRDKNLFQYLREQSVAIEKELGARLEWIDAAVASRIVETSSGFDINKASDYPMYFDWLIARALTFKKVFADRIRNYKQKS